MGFQNVYRQYLASILMTVGFLSMDQKKRKSVFIATFSACLVHNASVLVAMILLMKSISKAFVQKNIIYFGVGLLIAALLFVYFTFMVRLKSNRDTGANMLLFYFMISALFVLIFGHRLTTHKGILLRSAVFLILLLPIFMISGGSTGGERIFMFVFPIFLYEVLKNSRHSIFSDRVVELVLFIIFCYLLFSVGFYEILLLLLYFSRNKYLKTCLFQ